MKRQSTLPATVGLTPAQEAEAWDLYEELGCMAKVAKAMQVNYHHISVALNADPIRLIDTRRVRAEKIAADFEARGEQGNKLADRLIQIAHAMLDHIQTCQREGTLTGLADPSFKRCLTPVEAYQWIMGSKQLDAAGKIAYGSARVAGEMRLLAEGVDQDGKAIKDPAHMSDEELSRLVAEMQLSGRALPWGVQQWLEARSAR